MPFCAWPHSRGCRSQRHAASEFQGSGVGAVDPPSACADLSGPLCAQGRGTFESERIGPGTFEIAGGTSTCTSFEATFTLATADGDTLVLDATARMTGGSNLCLSPGGTFEATFAIVDGTGAFASAGGGGVMAGRLKPRSPSAAAAGFDLVFGWDGRIATAARARFTATGNGSIDLTAPCPPDLCADARGTVQASHLGEGVFAAEVRLHPATTTSGATICREFTAFVDLEGEEGKTMRVRATGVVVGQEDFCSGMSRIEFEGTFAVIGGNAVFAGGGALEGVVRDRSALEFTFDGLIAR